MDTRIVDIGEDFHPRLANRNKKQGDGKHSAEDFRKKYLVGLDNQKAWEDDTTFIVLDFSKVKRLGPSFANEAFGYFTKFASPSKVLKKINFINIPDFRLMTIKEELDTGYIEN